MASNAEDTGGPAKKKRVTKRPAKKKKTAAKRKPSVALDAEAAQEAIEQVRASRRIAAEETDADEEPEADAEMAAPEPAPTPQRPRIRRPGAETVAEPTKLPSATAIRSTVTTRTTRGVRSRDITSFLRQLIMLLESGTPLLKALNTLAQRGEHHGIRSMVAGMCEYVEAGNPLWQAFAREERHFSTVFVNLIKASEATGTLTVVLNRLVDYRERREMLSRRMQTALIYPLVILAVGFGAIVLISKFVIPEFRNIFNSFGVEISTFAAFFMGMSDVVANFWWLFALIVVALVLFYRYVWVRSPARRILSDRIKLRLPIAGNISRKSAVAEFTRTFALLQRSGLSMLVTLDLVRNSVTNRAYASTIQDMRDSVERGEGMERPLREAERKGLFPSVVVDMLVTGEETGRMDTIADQVADVYEEEVKLAVETIGEVLQPIVLVFMGGVVLMIALAFVGPLVEMIDKITAGGAY